MTAVGRRVLAGPWTFRRVAAGGDAAIEPWRPATVPGTVHTDLLANGLIGDPFFRLNERDQQWIERASWEYRTDVVVDRETASRERVELVFAGLDTFAEIFVNGESVLWATNMFRSWRVDVKDRLQEGGNQLVVRFRSPILQVMPAHEALGYRLPAANDQATEMVSMWARKAPYHYGWDWGPRLVTSGIWRPITLEAWDGARLEDLQVHAGILDERAAELTVMARVVAARACRVRVEVTLDGGAAGPTVGQEADLDAGATDVAVPLRLAQPERWWPNGLGPQRLYAVQARLVDARTGAPRDEQGTRTGLRTLEVVHQRDDQGKSFTVRVNGAPVFMKGANWIPADSFLPRVTPGRYRALLGAAADAHMNMVRVWGGGVYEDDRFYDLCDELGLLVWQDFMFACSMYPGDAAFVENVRREVVENVRRLRNHPSLALWAGNNENEAAWRGWGWPARFGLSRAAEATIVRDYQTMFHELLPSVVAAEDPGRFYTRSSPSANEERVPANQSGWGDMHYWGVWHGERPYEAYGDAENVSRFMSEYGFQSFPELASVARYTDRATDWDVESEVMRAHQRHPRGNALIATYMNRDFRPPKDFPSFLHLGQVLQATVIKYAAEAHRRAMGHTWGSLYWQLDDCWPVASWSGIDYYGRRKALHWFARRFFAPILVSVVERKGKVEVWVVSDRRTARPARLTLRLIDFAGGEVWRRDEDLTVAANASRLCARLPRRRALAGASPARVVLVAELAARDGAGELLSRNLLTFTKDKDLELPRPQLRLEAEPRADDGSFAVKVTSEALARHVFLSASGGEGGWPPSGDSFDDNYFDVLPGETRVIRCRLGTLAPDPMAVPVLRALSLVDTSAKRSQQKTRSC